MKFVIISDTHIDSTTKLPVSLINEIKKADIVLHAGDIVGKNMLNELILLNPNTYAVRGNMDTELISELPKKRELNFENVKIGLIHGDTFYGNMEDYLFYSFPDSDIIIYGHTHIPVWTKIDDKYFLNPGSVTRNRGGFKKNTYAILNIEKGKFDAEIIEL